MNAVIPPVTFLSMTGVLLTNSYMPPLTEESLTHFATHCFKSLHLKFSLLKCTSVEYGINI
jgi:hypothetical protein